jgi:hypothetical protein
MKTTLLIACLLLPLAARCEEPKPAEAAPASPTASVEPAATPAPSPWKFESVGQADFAQAYFDNWGSGGTDSMTWKAALDFKALREGASTRWENKLRAAYGQTRLSWDEPRKSVDELKVQSTGTWKLWSLVNPFADLKMETILADSQDFSTSPARAIAGPFDPAYYYETVGLGYGVGEVFKTYLGATGKQTVTNRFAKPYADDPSTPDTELTRIEYGASWNSELRWKISESAQLVSSLDSFSNLKASDQIVAKWKNVLTAKISKYVVLSAEYEMWYDKFVSTRRQVREGFSLGVSYAFL